MHVEDPFGNTVTSDTSTVTLTLAGGTFSGGSSTATATASGGVATFAGLVIDKAGTYTLSASDGLLVSPSPSGTFTISPAAASQVAFKTSALTLSAGSLGQITVDLADSYNNQGATSTGADDQLEHHRRRRHLLRHGDEHHSDI